MKKRHGVISFLLASICCYQSVADPAPERVALRADMTAEQADAVLKKYIQPAENRGGLCLIGFNPGASLDYDSGASANDAKIEFTGFFGKPLLFGKTLTVGDFKIESELKTFVVDTKRLKKIRIISKRVENTRLWCPNVQPNFLVVLYPYDKLPSDAELSINVSGRDELDELLAALTWLSPKARLVGKIKT